MCPVLDRRHRTRRLGLVLLVGQVLTIPAELLVASRMPHPYSFTGSWISELGAVTCARHESAAGVLTLCSPWHAVMNTVFVAAGILLVAGAVLARPSRASALLWGIAGLGSIGTGLVPLDVALDLHMLVSAPIAPAQSVAVVLTALAMPAHRRTLRRIGLVVGGATLVVGFVSVPELSGLLQRAALWPTTLWLALTALVLLRDSSGRTPRSP
ncbi:DUF998 domain-containing protein [Pseudonocardia phyllosphaerae]|uniref:DUF998 domain-containing protein n=1 Tax=Pseudonocardia phyllosphaerae TaxID=3390502 RepID=UPI00397D3FD5